MALWALFGIMMIIMSTFISPKSNDTESMQMTKWERVPLRITLSEIIWDNSRINNSKNSKTVESKKTSMSEPIDNAQ